MSSVKRQLDRLIEEDWERLGMQEEIYKKEHLYEAYEELEREQAKIIYNDDNNATQKCFEQGNGCEHVSPAKIIIGEGGPSASATRISENNVLSAHPSKERPDYSDTE
jgi:hypothetical protein